VQAVSLVKHKTLRLTNYSFRRGNLMRKTLRAGYFMSLMSLMSLLPLVDMDSLGAEPQVAQVLLGRGLDYHLRHTVLVARQLLVRL
jgi:hypothetical protein